MVAGAAVSAAGAYLFQLIAGRALGTEEFAPIGALWTLQFISFTVLFTPVEQYIIRRLTLSGGARGALRDARVPLFAVLVLGVAAATGFVAVTTDAFFQGDGRFVLIGAVLFSALGTYAVARGVLAGRRRFRTYGIMVAGEAAVRVGLTLVMVAVARTAFGMGWALAVAPLVYWAARPWRRPPAHQQPIREDDASAGRFLGGLVVATGASQTLLAAGPLLVEPLGAGPGEFSVVFITFTLFRGPLTASYNILARILPWFTARTALGQEDALRRWSYRLGLIAAAGAAAIGAAAAAVGPAVVAVLFGEEFRPTSLLAGLAAAGVVLAAGALIIGQILIARGTTGILGVLWIVALAVGGLVVLIAAGTPAERVGWGLVGGEVTALVGTMAVAGLGARRG
jgi:hypothetical protein